MEKLNVRFIIQIAGKPVENVQKALEVVLGKLKEGKDKFKVLDSDIVEPEFDKETTLFSGFLDVLVRFDNSHEVLNFILDYTPNSVEVESPKEINLNSIEFTGILNDFSRSLLENHQTIRKLNANLHHLIEKIKK